jgi:hypothetical protein
MQEFSKILAQHIAVAYTLVLAASEEKPRTAEERLDVELAVLGRFIDSVDSCCLFLILLIGVAILCWKVPATADCSSQLLTASCRSDNHIYPGSPAFAVVRS